MITYKIHFIRHGKTAANEEGRFVGITDIPLSEQGRDDLENLIRDYKYPEIKKAYSSPLLRCRETAEIIYPGIDIQIVQELREYNFGIYENMLFSEIKDRKLLTDWALNGINSPEGGDTKEYFMEMISCGFDHVVRDMMSNSVNESVVITHAGVIAALLSAFGLPRKKIIEWKIEYGKGYTVVTSSQMWARDGLFEIFTPVPLQSRF